MRYFFLTLLFPLLIGSLASLWIYFSVQTFNGVLTQALQEIERVAK
jgi:hypothetical protein